MKMQLGLRTSYRAPHAQCHTLNNSYLRYCGVLSPCRYFRRLSHDGRQRYHLNGDNGLLLISRGAIAIGAIRDQVDVV